MFYRSNKRADLVSVMFVYLKLTSSPLPWPCAGCVCFLLRPQEGQTSACIIKLAHTTLCLSEHDYDSVCVCVCGCVCARVRVYLNLDSLRLRGLRMGHGGGPHGKTRKTRAVDIQDTIFLHPLVPSWCIILVKVIVNTLRCNAGALNWLKTDF